MKTFTSEEARSNLEDLLETAQSGKVVILREGRPSAVVIGVDEYDDEDLNLAHSAEFWNMIAQRRSSGNSISIEEARERLGIAKNGNLEN